MRSTLQENKKKFQNPKHGLYEHVNNKNQIKKEKKNTSTTQKTNNKVHST